MRDAVAAVKSQKSKIKNQKFPMNSNCQQLPIAATTTPAQPPIAADSCQQTLAETALIGTCRQSSAAIGIQITLSRGAVSSTPNAAWLRPWAFGPWRSDREPAAA
jgi:hypothetical protein